MLQFKLYCLPEQYNKYSKIANIEVLDVLKHGHHAMLSPRPADLPTLLILTPCNKLLFQYIAIKDMQHLKQILDHHNKTIEYKTSKLYV